MLRANFCPSGPCSGTPRQPSTALHTEIMRPSPTRVPALTETLDAYLDSGGAIEACARKLFVHPNTVRYRLKRIADFTGRDPTLPRDAYVLRVAATVGRWYPVAADHGTGRHPPHPDPGRRGRADHRAVFT